MLDHGMAGVAELAFHARALGPRLRRGEGDALAHVVALDAVESPEEVEVPPRAAELAVGDGVKSDFFLLFDDALDFAILDRLQRLAGYGAAGALRARFMNGRRPEQAADVVGAERRLCAVHGDSLIDRCERRSA
jgi:hypothetical protein